MRMTPRLQHLLPVGCLVLALGCTPKEGIDTEASASDTGSETTVVTDSDEPPTGTTMTPESDATTQQQDTDTGPGTDTGPATETAGETDTSTGDPPIGEECQLSLEAPEPYFMGNGAVTWLDPVDETCSVVSSALIGDSIELHLDCPQHALLHGEVTLIFQSGPMPGFFPDPGDFLDVFYQPERDDGITEPRPELLFISTEGELLYAAARGFFINPADAAAAAARYAPLTVTIEDGPCPKLDNPAFEDEGDGYTCKREAVGQVKVQFMDEEPLVLGEGQSGDLFAGPYTYGADVRLVRRGELCVETSLDKFALAVVFLASI